MWLRDSSMLAQSEGIGRKQTDPLQCNRRGSRRVLGEALLAELESGEEHRSQACSPGHLHHPNYDEVLS